MSGGTAGCVTEPTRSKNLKAFEVWKVGGSRTKAFATCRRVPATEFVQACDLFEEAVHVRWCLKLAPECAMASYGLAATSLNWFTTGDLEAPEVKRGLAFLWDAARAQHDTII